MARLFIVVIFACTLAACAPHVPDTHFPRNEPDAGPKFTVSCYHDEFDAFERQIARRNCSVSVDDFHFKGDQYKNRPIFEKIAQIDTTGIRIGIKTYRPQGCYSAPRLLMSVDRKRIDTMPLTAQIAAMKAGSVFDYEVPNQYPYCNTRFYVTRLQGFAAAYDEMLQKWTALK